MKTFILLCLSLGSAALAQNTEGLRERKHHLTWGASHKKTETEIKVGTNKANSSATTTKSELTYGYQILPQLQPYLGFSTETTTGSGAATARAISFGVRAQLFENVPGNNVIPFVFAEIGQIFTDVTIGNASVGLTGSTNLGGVGIDYYPFGELIALRASYGFGGALLTGSSSGQSTQAAINPSGLMFDFVLAY